MKRLVGVAVLAATAVLLAPAPVAAQADELKAKRDKKLTEPWFTSNDWTADYDEALKRAKETKKVIFAYFTRSYAY